MKIKTTRCPGCNSTQVYILKTKDNDLQCTQCGAITPESAWRAYQEDLQQDIKGKIA